MSATNKNYGRIYILKPFTYQAAYPNARILYASEKDFSTANRVRFFLSLIHI